MWSVDGGSIEFRRMQAIIGEHPNHLSIACQRLQERGYIAFNAYAPDSSIVQLLPDGREFAASHELTDARAILMRAAQRAAAAEPPDYALRELHPGELTITAITERAQVRGSGRLGKGNAVVFKGHDPELLRFISEAEAAGFSVSGKELLSQ
jgi:hypothetical protein